MAAPSSTKWGNTVTGSKSTRKGKIGIYVGVKTTATQVTVEVQTWFWSMYSVDDVNNSYYYNAASSATTLIGSVNIAHTVATGSGWSTSNQTLLGTAKYTYNRGTSASTKYYAAKLTGIESMGTSNVMTVSTSVTVPALSSYTVSYNANGGSGAPSNQTKWYGKSLTLSTTKPTRPGYSFLGWSTANDSSVEYDPGDSYTANAAVTLYAVWGANGYTVSYNANGGSGAPASQTKTHGVTLKLSSTKPTRTNYTFKGWATTSTATTATYQAGGNYTNNAAVTLYAVWELAYTKPVITDFSVDRCNSSGTIDDSGTYALVKFNWRSEYDVSSIKIEYKLASSNTWTVGSTQTITSGTRSGSINSKIGNGTMDTDHSYDISVTITDANGNVSTWVTLPGTAYIIDIYKEGKGLAFGKPAEHEGIFEVGFPARFTGGVNGNLHVTGGTTSFPDLVFKASYQGTGVNFNNYKTSGVFGIYGACTNGPIVAGQIGVLIVSAYTADWVHQEFIMIDGGNGSVTRYERCLYLGTTWTAWTIIEQKGKLYSANGVIAPKLYGTGNYSVKFGVGNNSELAWIYQSGGATDGSKWFAPATDNALLLGASSYRWGQIYSTASTISTSDRNQKKDFENLDERYEELFEKLKPQLYKFKDGTSDRKHVGFISQDVEESMQEIGLTDKEFAGFCKDVKQKETGRDEETGEVFFEDVRDDDGNPVYNYSLRYEEFIALNTYMIQKQRAEIDALKEEITKLTNMVNNLKSSIEQV